MRLENINETLDARNADLSRSRFEDVNANVSGMTIGGVTVTDLLASYEKDNG
jgi:hypothetical protein